MSKFGAFLAGLGGVAVLVGDFVPSLGDKYFLVIAGAVLAIIGAIVTWKSSI